MPQRGPAWIASASALWILCALALVIVPRIDTILEMGAHTPTPKVARVVKIGKPKGRAQRVVPERVHEGKHRSPRKPDDASKHADLKEVGNFSLPVRSDYVSGRTLKSKHHDYPALDIPLPRGTGVHAIVAGRVQRVTHRGSCGNGVIMRDKRGFTYTYCHAAKTLVRKGRHVGEGTAIMRSGSTGNSTGPHLHLQIQRPSGRLVCPQSLLEAWAHGKKVSPRKDRDVDCYPGARRHRLSFQQKHHHPKHDHRKKKH